MTSAKVWTLECADPIAEFERKPDGDSGPYRTLASEVIAQCHETIATIERIIDENPNGVGYRYEFNRVDLRGKGTRLMLARIEQEIAWLARRNGFPAWASMLRCDGDELEDAREVMLDRARMLRARLKAIQPCRCGGVNQIAAPEAS